MPIKKSSLEKKWYYRVAKILFLLIPIIVIVFLFLNNRIDISNLPKGNISDILQNDIVYIIGGLILYFIVISAIWRIFLYIAFGGLENDTRKINANAIQQSVSPVPQSTPAKVIGPIIVIIFCIAIFAIAFSQTNTNPFKTHIYGTACTTSDGKTGLYGTNETCYTCSADSTAVTSPVNNCSDGIAGVYCCNAGNNNGGNNGGSKCVPTGCGALWRCSGSYYLGERHINFTGCLPVSAGEIYSSWTGTCRQCP